MGNRHRSSWCEEGRHEGGAMVGDGSDRLVAVRGARLVDVEAGKVLEGRGLLVRGERIEGPLDPGQSPPEGAEVVDLAGHTLLPGLIDCHTHLVGELQGSGILAIDRSAAQEALSGVGNARATVLAGFTSVRDVGTFRAFVDVALRDAIRDGTVTGPRMAVAGAYVTVPGGGGAVTGLAPDIELPRDPARRPRAVRGRAGRRRRGGGRPGHPRRRPRPRHPGDRQRRQGRRPLDRARLAAGRRGGRPAGRAGHLPGRRHLQRRLHRRRGGPAGLERPPAALHGQARDDHDGRHPVGNGGRGRAARLGGPGRGPGPGPPGRRDRRPRRPPRRPGAAGRRPLRDAGWPDPQRRPARPACPLVGRRAILSGVTSATATSFVGRAEELDRLLRLLDRAERGRPAVGLIAGDAGVGKTRLLDELAARAESRRARVLTGGCMEVGDVGLPYVPFVDAFRDLGARPGEAAVAAPLAAAVPSLGRLLPELATDAGPAPPPGDGFERVQLFDGVLSLLARLSELAPLLLVIEDLHWADRSTRDLLAFLVRTLRGGRVALVASYRSDELHRRHPLRPLLAELVRVPDLERIELAPFGRVELAEHLQAVVGQPVPPAGGGP